MVGVRGCACGVAGGGGELTSRWLALRLMGLPSRPKDGRRGEANLHS